MTSKRKWFGKVRTRTDPDDIAEGIQEVFALAAQQAKEHDALTPGPPAPVGKIITGLTTAAGSGVHWKGGKSGYLLTDWRHENEQIESGRLQIRVDPGDPAVAPLLDGTSLWGERLIRLRAEPESDGHWSATEFIEFDPEDDDELSDKLEALFAADPPTRRSDYVVRPDHAHVPVASDNFDDFASLLVATLGHEWQLVRQGPFNTPVPGPGFRTDQGVEAVFEPVPGPNAVLSQRSRRVHVTLRQDREDAVASAVGPDLPNNNELLRRFVDATSPAMAATSFDGWRDVQGPGPLPNRFRVDPYVMPGVGEFVREHTGRIGRPHIQKGSWITEVVEQNVFPDTPVRFSTDHVRSDGTFAGTADEEAELGMAFQQFVTGGAQLRDATAPYLHEHWEQTRRDVDDEEIPETLDLATVWSHLDFRVAALDPSDGIGHVNLEFGCTWCGSLQIVYRRGNELVRVGPFTGHLYNSDPSRILDS